MEIGSGRNFSASVSPRKSIYFRITEKTAESAFSGILLLSRLSGWRPFEMWDKG
jgi:hypothetical protein